MATALALLYETLVAESKYEARGSEYRARLKDLYTNMRRDMLSCGDVVIKGFRQSLNKYMESLVQAVDIVDALDLDSQEMDVCTGIRQYVFPRIPEIDEIDVEFVSRWEEFYNYPLSFGRVTERSKKRQNSEKKSQSMSGSKKKCHHESEDSLKQVNHPVLLTEEDLKRPKMPKPPEPIVSKRSRHTEHKEAMEHQEPIMYTKLPILMNKRVEFKDDTIIFGLIPNDKLATDWASVSSCNSYNDLIRQFHEYDNKIPNVEQKSKTTCKKHADITSTEYYTAKTTSEHEPSSQSVSSNEGEDVDKIIDVHDFYDPLEERYEKLPGNFKQDIDNFDPDSIFGNYYCPVDKNVPVPKLEVPPQEEVAPSLCQTMITVSHIQVTSAYTCDASGTPHVTCTARFCEPKLPKIPSEMEFEPPLGTYQELQHILSRLFALKKVVSGSCEICSGWNLVHGCTLTFCEYCEDRLLNFKPQLLLQIFQLRRYLASHLYAVMGYKFETTSQIIKDGDFIRDWRKLLDQQGVSIHSLCEIGGSFPKASIHDSRFQPSCLSLPQTICNTLNSFQYPKVFVKANSELHSRVFTICRERRNARAKLMNDYFETLYNYCNNTESDECPQHLADDYNNIFKNGLLLSSQHSIAQENTYFDELVSYLISRLPFDDHLLRLSFFHKGIYAIKPNNMKSSVLLSIGKCFGFSENDTELKYNWHETLQKSTLKKGAGYALQRDTTGLVAHALKKHSCQALHTLGHIGFLQGLPSPILFDIIETGRVKIGFPTALEMHVLSIPDSVLDPCMYGDVGKGLVYSLPVLLQNLSLLGSILKIGTSSSGKKRKPTRGMAESETSEM
ncbi:hypothetical protein BEWA_023830 [Theileria equi strain WA]|uniref:Uncharacterized protein n=1 Tax=Theileria equi strain WA TaxID=1537102 RepID=L0AXB1_THEEQ|nr:hypothetical protein BEWA_023830 [Theileria equi strain WA]AFZ79534.1 hypothetical protein BEWA_023830 [Theileria equi strain WA]|eukprot:XP_004829200.1 hypothetical protein BEWA_023830 [Theileria equi strain WA]